MTSTGKHAIQDRILAEVRLIERRLRTLGRRLGQQAVETEADLVEQHAELITHWEGLHQQVSSCGEAELSVSSAVGDLAAAVDALESDLAALDQTEPSEYELAVDRQVRAWRTTLDRLRLQSSLAAMEARDELDGASYRLDRVRGDVLVELQNILGDTKKLVVDLRSDVEDVLGGVRQAVRKVMNDVMSQPKTDGED